MNILKQHIRGIELTSNLFLLYCSRCNKFIGELKLFGKLPEAFKKHVICKKCLTRD